ELPPTVAISRLVNSLKEVSSHRLWQESRTCALITGGPSACCPGRTPSDRPAARPSPPCTVTLNSRTVRPDRSLKAGTLATILVATASSPRRTETRYELRQPIPGSGAQVAAPRQPRHRRPA